MTAPQAGYYRTTSVYNGRWVMLGVGSILYTQTRLDFQPQQPTSLITNINSGITFSVFRNKITRCTGVKSEKSRRTEIEHTGLLVTASVRLYIGQANALIIHTNQNGDVHHHEDVCIKTVPFELTGRSAGQTISVHLGNIEIREKQTHRARL